MAEERIRTDGIKTAPSERSSSLGDRPIEGAHRFRRPHGNAGATRNQISHTIQNSPEFEALNKIYKQGGIALDSEEVDVLSKNKPQRPDFPMIVFLAALTKDIIDIVVFVATIGTLGWIIIWVLNIIIIPILWLWILGKISGAKRVMARTVTRWFIGIIIGETFLGPVPLWTFFVLMAHYRDKKFVQLVWKTLERADEIRKGHLKEAVRAAA